MRMRYLRIALLTGFLAATLFPDSTSTNSKAAALREERSPPPDRNGITASGASVDNGDRAGLFQARKMTASKFFKEVLLHDIKTHSTFLNGSSNRYNTMVLEKKTPQEEYKAVVNDVTKPLLTTVSWKRWAFFTSKYCVHHNKNPHEYIVEVMSEYHGVGQFVDILAMALESPIMTNLVEKLQEVQISLWSEKKYSLRHVFSLLQVKDVWANYIFASPRFATWTRYLQHVRTKEYEVYPLFTEIFGLWEFIAFEDLLMMPMLPENAFIYKSAQYLQAFKSIGLYKMEFPYQFVSILVNGVEKDDEKFTLLFVYGPTRDFWMSYVDEFNEQYPHLAASLWETLKPARAI